MSMKSSDKIEQEFETWAQALGLPVSKNWCGKYSHTTLLAWEAYKEGWLKSMNSQGIYYICTDHTDKWFVSKASFKGETFNTEAEAIEWAEQNGYNVRIL